MQELDKKPFEEFKMILIPLSDDIITTSTYETSEEESEETGGEQGVTDGGDA